MKPVVLASFEDDERLRCVDVFRRHDGTFGFEHYRSEADGSRWQSLGPYAQLTFATGAEALAAAKSTVAWLDPALAWRW